MIKHEPEKNCQRLINTCEEVNFDLAHSCIIHKIHTANVIAKSPDISTATFPGDISRRSLLVLKSKCHIDEASNILVRTITFT